MNEPLKVRMDQSRTLNIEYETSMILYHKQNLDSTKGVVHMASYTHCAKRATSSYGVDLERYY